MIKLRYLYSLPVFLIMYLSTFTNCQAQESHVKRIAPLSEKIDESSGLIQTPKGLFTINDKKKPKVFRIDPQTGEILQTISIENVEVSDPEALAFDGEHIYMGDFGNNDGSRTDLKILKIPFAAIGQESKESLQAEVITFHYPEQKNFDMKKKENEFDCEAMIVRGDSLYLFTKRRNDHKTALYALPKTSGNYKARLISIFNAKGLITDATLSPSGKEVWLLGYQKKHLYPFIWKLTDFKGENVFNGKQQYFQLTNQPIDWQTEGITFKNAEQIYISCERSDQVIEGLYLLNIKDLVK
jgi:hypothetical protein